MVIELPLESNTAYLSGFPCVRNITFVQHSSVQVNGRSTVSLVRKSPMLEAGGFSTLFRCENELTFERNIAYLRLSMCEQHHLCAK
jgi:hypothetical protein